METSLVRIGNSHGVRLPKAVIEQAGLTQRLELEVTKGAVIIRSAKQTRHDWEEAAALCHAEGADQVEDWDVTIADFDGEWQWK